MSVISGGGSSGGSSGGSGSGSLLFSSVLSAPAASIDTLATLSGAFNVLEVFMYLRTDEAVTGSNVKVTLNNDSGANYDRQVLAGANAAVSAATATAGTSWLLTCCGASNESNLFSYNCLRFPNYAGTTGFKVAQLDEGIPDSTAANMDVRLSAFGYRSTSAISRLAIAPNTGGRNLVAGSAVYIYGR